jgi:hypothetical protein
MVAPHHKIKEIAGGGAAYSDTSPLRGGPAAPATCGRRRLRWGRCLTPPGAPRKARLATLPIKGRDKKRSARILSPGFRPRGMREARSAERLASVHKESLSAPRARRYCGPCTPLIACVPRAAYELPAEIDLEPSSRGGGQKNPQGGPLLRPRGRMTTLSQTRSLCRCGSP